MERPQLERREKIADALVAAAAVSGALIVKKEGWTGIARRYPGNHFFSDLVNDVKEVASLRLAFLIKSDDPFEVDFDGDEPTEELLDKMEQFFEVDKEPPNPLQTP